MSQNRVKVACELEHEIYERLETLASDRHVDVATMAAELVRRGLRDVETLWEQTPRRLEEALRGMEPLDRRELIPMLESMVPPTSGEDSQLASDPTNLTMAIIQAGRSVFEGEDLFRQWLATPARAFSGRTPYDMLNSTEGIKEVVALLGRLEFGVFS